MKPLRARNPFLPSDTSPKPDSGPEAPVQKGSTGYSAGVGTAGCDTAGGLSPGSAGGGPFGTTIAFRGAYPKLGGGALYGKLVGNWNPFPRAVKSAVVCC